MSVSPTEEPLLPDLDAIGGELKDLEQKARAMIQERPVVAILVAAGVGYLVARLAARANR